MDKGVLSLSLCGGRWGGKWEHHYRSPPMKALRRLDRGTRLTLLARSLHPVALLVKFRKRNFGPDADDATEDAPPASVLLSPLMREEE